MNILINNESPNNLGLIDFNADHPKSNWLGRIVSVIKIVVFPFIKLNDFIRSKVLSIFSDHIFGSKEAIKSIDQAKRDEMGGPSLKLMTPDKRIIEAQYIQGKSAQVTNQTVILFTGSHFSYEQYAPKYVEEYTKRGLNVLCLNYGGFGKSEGQINEDTMKLDAETAYQFLQKTKHVDDSQVVAHGYSLGAYPATYLCSQHPIKKLVFDRGFSSMANMVRDNAKKVAPFPGVQTLAYWLAKYSASLNNESIINAVQGDILLIRGESDFTILPYHQEALIKKLGQTSRLTYKTLPIGHNNYNSVWIHSPNNAEETHFFDEWLSK